MKADLKLTVELIDQLLEMNLLMRDIIVDSLRLINVDDDLTMFVAWQSNTVNASIQVLDLLRKATLNDIELLGEEGLEKHLYPIILDEEENDNV